jgi:hypothetical protein
VKYAFIERNRHRWPISLACEVLGVSPSGYHERKSREIADTSRPRRSISNDALLVHISASWRFAPPATHETLLMLE